MTLSLKPIQQQVMSHAMGTGLFQNFAGHEPKNAPGVAGVYGMTSLAGITPVQGASGLNSVSIKVTLTVRIFISGFYEPADDMEPLLCDVVDKLCELFAGDFQLGGLIRNVDLLGEFGEPMSVTTGWLTQDSKVFRIADILLPLIINDVWTETP